MLRMAVLLKETNSKGIFYEALVILSSLPGETQNPAHVANFITVNPVIDSARWMVKTSL